YSTPESVELLDLASGEVEPVGGEGSRYAVWSPDGVYLAVGGSNPSLLRTSDLSSEIGYYPYVDASFSFSADSTAFVRAWSYFSDVGERYNTVRSDVAVALYSAVVVGASPRPMAYPSPSPDGQWLVMAQGCGDSSANMSLWVTPYYFATPACEGRPLTPRDGVTATNPEWGPGSLIAFEYGDSPRDIAIVDANTGQQCYIPRAGDDRNPSWVRVPLPPPEPPR
ncbi:MAG: hypothetical protein ABW217_20895, partial [Polyangiaceae bacterium]